MSNYIEIVLHNKINHRLRFQLHNRIYLIPKFIFKEKWTNDKLEHLRWGYLFDIIFMGLVIQVQLRGRVNKLKK